ncbi:S8 family serine peptidase [Flavimaricola sp.]|nr:autotransporter serine protease [Flavimaricola sp.]MDA9019692.1 S8 family serine peptidase [Flavimaricola sp.]
MTDRTTTKSLLLASTLILSSTLAIGQEQPTDFLTEEFFANWGLDNIRAQYAWSQGFTGKGEKIAIVDEPAQVTHPEFIGRALFSTPNQTFPMEGFPIPSHGTHVMGLAGAARNDEGIMGIAFEAELVSVLDDVGAPGYEVNKDWSAEVVSSGARVMNGSFGFPAYPRLLLGNGQENPDFVEVDIHVIFPSVVLQYAANIERLAQGDVVMVFGAGNDRAFDIIPPGEQRYWETIQPYAANNPMFPAALPLIRPENTLANPASYRFLESGSILNDPIGNWFLYPKATFADWDYSNLAGSLIAVVATDQDNRIAPFSNYCGLAADWCLAAPGFDLLSTVPMNTYDSKYGTSMAAPLVAGGAALVRQAFPYMTARQVIEVLLTSSTDLGDSSIYGHGLLNLERAVKGPVEFGHPSLLPGEDSIFAPVFAVDTEGHDSIWSNDISGAGGFRKAGDGRLTLTGDNSYTGATEILGGTLRVDGSIATSDLTVAGPARVEGRGTLSTAQVAGTIAPGNSVGVLNIAGDLNLQSGARIEAEIDATGADLIAITGDVTIDPNVTLVMLAQPGLMLDTGYEVLTTGGTITGNIANVEDPHPFLDARLVAGSSSLTLSAERNATGFSQVAQTANQRALAQAFDGLDPGDPAVAPVVFATSAVSLPDLFSTLSGEIYASLPAARMGAAMDLSGVLSARLAQSPQVGPEASPEASPRFWSETHGARGQFEGRGLASDLDHSHHALTFGMEVTGEANATFGLGLSVAKGLAQSPGACAETDDVTLFAYGGILHEGLRLSSGITQVTSNADVSRTVAGLADTSLRGHLTHAFVELGLPRDYSAGLRIEPFLRAGHVSLRQNGITETGAAQALSVAGIEADVTQATLGLRLAHEWQGADRPWRIDGTAAWQTNHGDIAPGLGVDLASGGAPFTVTGARLPEDTVTLDFGISTAIGQTGRFNLALGGGLGESTHDYRMQAGLEWRF